MSCISAESIGCLRCCATLQIQLVLELQHFHCPIKGLVSTLAPHAAGFEFAEAQHMFEIIDSDHGKTLSDAVTTRYVPTSL